MSLDWVRVTLRGYGGETPTGDTFFAQLGLQPDAGFVSRTSGSPWQAASLTLVEVTFQDVEGAEEPHEEFAARMERGLMRAAEWLMSRPEEAFDGWRAAGRKVDIFIGGWLNDQQFDLDLPAAFLLACGRAGLPITICTND
jgi:hypothetical protein